MTLSLIVAIARNNAIGYQNKLLYWLPDDLKRFKQLTTGHTIIMGRNTFESLPKGALPNRRNVVLSQTAQAPYPGTELYRSLEQALASCKAEEEVFVIGGERLYRTAVELADRLYVTAIDDLPQAADAFFPEIDTTQWKVVSSTPHPSDEKHRQAFTFMDYERI